VLQFVLHRSDPNLLNIRQKKSPGQSRARRWSDRRLWMPGDPDAEWSRQFEELALDPD
jgi:hypothetical protein